MRRARQEPHLQQPEQASVLLPRQLRCGAHPKHARIWLIFHKGCVNSDGDDLNQIVQTNEIIRISCDQRQFLSHGNRCDQQVGKALARLTSVASDGGEDLSIGTGRGDSEGYGLEGRLDSLESILSASPPTGIVGCSRASRQFSHGDRGNGETIGQAFSFQEYWQIDDDGRVEQRCFAD